MQIKNVCVCGAGTMGSGIAQVAAAAGYPTILYDLDTASVEKAKAKMQKDLQVLVDKQKIIRLINFTSTIGDCIADIVIEAIVEKPGIKTSLFNQLAQINSPQTIF